MREKVNTKQAHDAHIKYCGATTRNGTPCQLVAGWGTDHVGEGRCKLHGGKSTGAPKQNKNAEKHGLFSKYLPEDTLDIFNELETSSTIDLLWDNIRIQYAAILRAQKLMEVKEQDEIKKAIKRIKDYDEMTEYEIQFAWDRQERFLNAQARAMTNLTNMIVKYEDLCRQGLANEEQQLRIEKLKADTERIKKQLETYDEEDINEVIVIDGADELED